MISPAHAISDKCKSQGTVSHSPKTELIWFHSVTVGNRATSNLGKTVWKPGNTASHRTCHRLATYCRRSPALSLYMFHPYMKSYEKFKGVKTEGGAPGTPTADEPSGGVVELSSKHLWRRVPTYWPPWNSNLPLQPKITYNWHYHPYSLTHSLWQCWHKTRPHKELKPEKLPLYGYTRIPH